MRDLCKCGNLKDSRAKQCGECYRGHLKISRQGKGNPMYGKRAGFASWSKKRRELHKIEQHKWYKNNPIFKVNHHLDLDKTNNKRDNILETNSKKHTSIHRRIYDYVLEKYGISEIHKYIKWFDRKYGVK
jgi:hypothetical protein